MRNYFCRSRLANFSLAAGLLVVGGLFGGGAASADEEAESRPEHNRFELIDDRENYFFQRFAPEAGTLEITGSVNAIGEVGKYWIGVECREVPPELRSQLELADGQGIVVVRISDDSAAEKAGLKRHDILMSAGDAKLSHIADLAKVVNESQGKEITLKIIRGGKEQSINVTPAERSRDVVKFIARPGPGMIIHGGPGGHHIELPDNMKVLIERQGKEPAKITVKRGDDSWEVNEEQLDKLPDDVRPIIERALGGGPVTLPLPGRPFEGMPGMRMRVEGVPPFGPTGQGPKMRVKVLGPGDREPDGPRPEGPSTVAPPPPPGPNAPMGPAVRAGHRGPAPGGELLPEMIKRLEMLDHRLEQLQDEVRQLRGDRRGPASGDRRPPPGGQREGRPREQEDEDDRPRPAPNRDS